MELIEFEPIYIYFFILFKMKFILFFRLNQHTLKTGSSSIDNIVSRIFSLKNRLE